MALFGSLREQYRALIREIENGSPITSRHAQPASITQDGFEMFAHAGVREGFDRSREYAVTVNTFLEETASPWRLQEVNETLLRLAYEDPRLGRNYDVFYNSANAGVVCLHGKIVFPEKQGFDGFYLQAEIRCAQLYSFEAMYSLLYWLTHPLVSTPEDQKGFEDRIARAMAEAAWEFSRDPETPANVDLYLHGPGGTLAHILEHRSRATP